MHDPGTGAPFAFRQAVAALAAARPRREVTVAPVPPPRRLAPYAYALGAEVTTGGGTGGPGEPDGPEEPGGPGGAAAADGRFVLLHDPAGEQSWQGDFRIVTLARGEIEPELGTDPLLPEVAWSWLTEALEGRGLEPRAPSGTVTRAGSHFFGGLADREPKAELELRASWTLTDTDEAAAHLLAWCTLLAQCAGLPPESSSPAVTAFPRRRGPRPA